MKELHPRHFEACSKGGVSQSEMWYICPHCDSIGSTNKMLKHIKICDGTGFKNYWSRKRSEYLRQVFSHLF